MKRDQNFHGLKYPFYIVFLYGDQRFFFLLGEIENQQEVRSFILGLNIEVKNI